MRPSRSPQTTTFLHIAIRTPRFAVPPLSKLPYSLTLFIVTDGTDTSTIRKGSLCRMRRSTMALPLSGRELYWTAVVLDIRGRADGTTDRIGVVLNWGTWWPDNSPWPNWWRPANMIRIVDGKKIGAAIQGEGIDGHIVTSEAGVEEHFRLLKASNTQEVNYASYGM